MSKAYPHDFKEQNRFPVGLKRDWNKRFSLPERFILGAIALCVAMQAALIFVQEINWDEYYFLSLIYEHQRGDLTKALQTIHVHMFGWLTLIGGSEVRQVEVARSIMLFFELGTMAGIYALSRIFVDRFAALVAVLAYISAGFVLLHGTSFRADPIAAFLMMGALVIVARTSLAYRHLAAASALIGLAGLVTVKAVFYAPALAGIGLWRVLRSQRPTRDLGKMVICAVGAGAFFAIIYAFHQSVLPAADLASSEAMMSSAAQTTLLQVDFFPRLGDVLQGTTLAVIPALLLITGTYFAVRKNGAAGNGRVQILALLSLCAPLLSFLFYRNAFPYYFAFIFPPAMVLVAIAAQNLNLSVRLWTALIAIMALSSVLLFTRTLERDQGAQTQIVETVHRMFPRAVATIDRNSMIASFPKRGIFMSTWGLKDYRQKGEPIFGDILQKDIVPLLILNSPTLEQAVDDDLTAPLRAKLLSEDRAILQQNYILHWGKIWVAGKTIKLSAIPSTVTIAIPGRYQLEASAPIMLNGRALSSGETLLLNRGQVEISSSVPQTIKFRWGEDLYRPDFRALEKPIYRGF